MLPVRHVVLASAGFLAGVATILACDNSMTPVPTADAQVADASTCNGTCTVTGPIRLDGVARVMTADTDPQRLRRGQLNVDFGGGRVIAEGPMVVTDLSASSGPVPAVSLLVAGKADNCNGAVFTLLRDTPIVGARLFIPSGQVLCGVASSSHTVAWAGFVPYEVP